LDAGFEGRRMTAASSRSIPSKQLSSDRRSGVLLKIEISPRHIVAAAVRAKQCQRRPNQEHAACSKDVEAGLIGATCQRHKRRRAGTTAK
jgi:hypothetical protein